MTKKYSKILKSTKKYLKLLENTEKSGKYQKILENTEKVVYIMPKNTRKS